jgi:hypothetical protein
VITTRLPVADLADHQGTSALRRDQQQLSGDAGAKLLRALGAKKEILTDAFVDAIYSKTE